MIRRRHLRWLVPIAIALSILSVVLLPNEELNYHDVIHLGAKRTADSISISNISENMQWSRFEFDSVVSIILSKTSTGPRRILGVEIAREYVDLTTDTSVKSGARAYPVEQEAIIRQNAARFIKHNWLPDTNRRYIEIGILEGPVKRRVYRYDVIAWYFLVCTTLLIVIFTFVELTCSCCAGFKIRSRRARNQCVQCGYEHFPGICPECGFKTSKEDPPT